MWIAYVLIPSLLVCGGTALSVCLFLGDFNLTLGPW
jgi:hypothetical protein